MEIQEPSLLTGNTPVGDLKPIIKIPRGETMFLDHYRRRINALKRRLAVPLAVVRLRPLAEEYCDQWVAAVADKEDPPPATLKDALDSGSSRATPFMQRVAAAGFRLGHWTAVERHIQQCRRDRQYPYADNILRLLLPKAVGWGLIPPCPPPVYY